MFGALRAKDTVSLNSKMAALAANEQQTTYQSQSVVCVVYTSLCAVDF